MTPNGMITLAQKRVKNTATGVIDWNSFYAMVIDEIFGEKEYKFAQRQINYIHPQSTFEKTFNADASEKALNKIKSIRLTTSYALPGPVPVANTGIQLDYEPLQRFMTLYPEQVTDGQPQVYTELVGSDGLNGMQIGIYPRPNADAAVWVEGNFIPTYTIDSNEMPILPKQFHRMVVDGMIHFAAEEAGQDRLSVMARRRFELAMKRLDEWDIRNQKYIVSRKPYDYGASRKGPLYPSNFPWPYSRWR